MKKTLYCFLALICISVASFAQINVLPGSPVVASGQVGIGTYTPSAPLEVSTSVLGNSPAIAMTNANNAAGGVGVTLQGKSGGGSQLLGEISIGGAGPAGTGGLLDFFTSNDGVSYSPRMRIASNGNVGIGTYSPPTVLSIGRADNIVGAFTHYFRFPSESDLVVGAAQTFQAGVSLVNFRGNGFEWFVNRAPNASDIWSSWGTRAMVIRESGNVGIGTTTPTAKLHVVGGLRIEGPGNGIVFPDGTTQTTASLSGSQGTQGPKGDKGDPGSPGIQGPTGPRIGCSCAFSCRLVGGGNTGGFTGWANNGISDCAATAKNICTAAGPAAMSCP